jgi:hypothetical protein
MTYKSYKDRYERGDYWNRKVFFWLPISMAFMVVNLASFAVNLAVKNAAWSWVIAIFALAMLACQLATFARMVVCGRRANKIWRSAL